MPADVFAGIMEKLRKILELLATGGGGPAPRCLQNLVCRLPTLTAASARRRIRSKTWRTIKFSTRNRRAQKFAQVMIITGARMGDATLIVNALKGNLGDLDRGYQAGPGCGPAYQQQTVAGAEQMETKLTAILDAYQGRASTGDHQRLREPARFVASECHVAASAS